MFLTKAFNYSLFILHFHLPVKQTVQTVFSKCMCWLSAIFISADILQSKKKKKIMNYFDKFSIKLISFLPSIVLKLSKQPLVQMFHITATELNLPSDSVLNSIFIYRTYWIIIFFYISSYDINN